MIEVVPESLGLVARSWDAQHLDLLAASRQVAGAGTDGFTPAVSGAARGFVEAWTALTADLGDDCHSCADALRLTIAEYLESDESGFLDFSLLQHFVGELT